MDHYIVLAVILLVASIAFASVLYVCSSSGQEAGAQ